MWRRLVRIMGCGCASALFLTSVSAVASDGTPSAHVVAPNSADKLIADYQQALFDGRFAAALAAADAMPVDSDNKQGQAVLDAMKASALLGLKRDSEAEKLITESNELAPQMPEPSSILFLGALLANHYEVAADVLDRMIARYPDAVRDIDWQLMRVFMTNQPKGETQRNQDRTVALARLGYGGETERGHYLVNDAVQILVNRPDFKSAAELLPYLKEPAPIEDMLIQKRYSPLWPQIEQLAGPHLQNIRTDAVAAAKRAYDSAPDDHGALANLANTLRHAGRLDEAAELRSKLPSTSAELGSADEDMGWAFNNIAYALHESGRASDADKLFALLNDAPMQNGGWRVSMKINRLEWLVTDGRFDAALPLLDPTAAAANTDGSPYARQLVRRLRYCVLSRLGRAADADKALPDMLAHASDAPGPTIDGLLCAGNFDAAEQVALKALSNTDVDKRKSFEGDFVRQLQAEPLTGNDPSVWQGRWAEFRKRPAIANAFDRLGRDMPQEFLPTRAIIVRSSSEGARRNTPGADCKKSCPTATNME